MFDDKEQKEVSSFIGIGIKGEKLFELKEKDYENIDLVAMMIKKCLEE